MKTDKSKTPSQVRLQAWLLLERAATMERAKFICLVAETYLKRMVGYCKGMSRSELMFHPIPLDVYTNKKYSGKKN